MKSLQSSFQMITFETTLLSAPVNRAIPETLGKSPVVRVCVVADAVQVEPVSNAKFPANREKNRDFCRIAVSVLSETVNNGVVTGLPKRIPYSTEQGIILAEQRILAQEQGILSAEIEIIVERDFQHKRRLGNVRFTPESGH